MAIIEEIPSTPSSINPTLTSAAGAKPTKSTITAIPTTSSTAVTSNGSTTAGIADDAAGAVRPEAEEDRGFIGGLIGSVFEPGVNVPLYQAMNASFLLLLLSLLFLAFITSWNGHVLFLMVVSTGLWVGMIWFVQEISKVQHSQQNGPPPVPVDGALGGDVVEKSRHGEDEEEGKKDR